MKFLLIISVFLLLSLQEIYSETIKYGNKYKNLETKDFFGHKYNPLSDYFSLFKQETEYAFSLRESVITVYPNSFYVKHENNPFEKIFQMSKIVVNIENRIFVPMDEFLLALKKLNFINVNIDDNIIRFTEESLEIKIKPISELLIKDFSLLYFLKKYEEINHLSSKIPKDENLYRIDRLNRLLKKSLEKENVEIRKQLPRKEDDLNF